ILRRKIGHGVARLGNRNQSRRIAAAIDLEGELAEAFAEHLVEMASRQSVHRELVGAEILRLHTVDFELVARVGRYAEFPFRLLVVWLEVLVGKRPVDADAMLLAELEVRRQHAQGNTHPVMGRAPEKPQIVATELQRTALNEIAVLRR